MRTTGYIQWYNANELRKYPVAEDSTGLDDSGAAMPDDIIADIGLMMPPVYRNVFISTLAITPHLVTVAICTATAGLLVGTYARSSVQPYTAYPLTGLADDVTGWIAFGAHGITECNHRFTTAAQSGLDRRAMHLVDPLPVKQFLRLGSNPVHTFADKVVTFRGQGGLHVEPDPVDPQKILVYMDEELAHKLVGPCDSIADEDNCITPPFRSINGVCPDDDGLITLIFE